MAYRGIPSSQADLDSGQSAFTTNVNSPLDFSIPSTYNGPSLINPWAALPNPANYNPLDPNTQHYPNPTLPPLAGLYEQQDHATDPYYQHHQHEQLRYQQQYQPHPYQQHSQQLPPISRYYDPPTQAINDYRNQETPGWASATAGSAFPRLDPGYQRQSPVNHAQDYSAAPPVNQQPPSSSFFVQNPHAQLPQPYRSLPESYGDEHYLNAIASGDFSSPSLPPINSSPRPPTRSHFSSLPKPLEVGETMPNQARDQRAGKGRLVDLTKEEPDSPSGVDPTTQRMPPFIRKRPLTADTRAVASKRRRSSASSPASGRVNRTKSKQSNDASPFVDDDPPSDPTNGDAHETIDLSNAADVPNDLLANKSDNRIKIGKFQCVICMDDASHLTVTHCGHLFCSECLHSALHIDNMKKTCPVCRTKVDPKDKKGKNQKSYYHLELKIMTANKKGKQPASSS